VPFHVPSNVPPWLPGVLFCVVFGTGAVAISLHPRFRNRFRARPAQPGQPNLFQRGRRAGGPDVMFTQVAGLLHYKPMMGAWYGVVSVCVFLAMVTTQMPLPISVTTMPVWVLLAVLAYLRPRRAVRSCYVDANGGIRLTRGQVNVPFDLNHYRYVRMHNSGATRATIPSMLVLYRDTQPSTWTWLSSILSPRVTDERVVLFFNRWWDADGYWVGPRDMAALFYQACVRAGHTPTKATAGWEVSGGSGFGKPGPYQ
jgi:hypothetical protein